MRWLAFLAVAVLASAVPAGAQVLGPGLKVELTAPPGLQVPGASAVVIATISSSCDAVVRNADPASPGQTVVSIVWDAPDFVRLAGNATVAIPLDRCTGAVEVTHEERYLLTLLPEAPGLKSLEVRITVDWAISQTSGNGASARMVVAADYRTETNVVVPRKLMVCDCNRFDFEVELTNLGNARTQYNFEVLEPPNGGAWDIQMPDPVVLDSPNSGGDHTSEKVVISVFADGGSGKGSYTIQILVASADQPDKKGEPIEVHLLANKEGLLDKATPGPGGPMLLVGLVGVALFSRRRA